MSMGHNVLTKIVNAVRQGLTLQGLTAPLDMGVQGAKLDAIAESTSATGVTIDGVLLKDNKVDVNGTADGLVLDADGDTTIEAVTDDVLEINVGGSLIAAISAAGLSVTGNISTSSAGFLKLLNAGTVAAAGTVQGDATALTNQISLVTAGDDATGVILPAAAAGSIYFVWNGGSAGLKIYPATDNDINNGSDNVAITILENTLAVLVALSDNDTWAAIYTANS